MIHPRPGGGKANFSVICTSESGLGTETFGICTEMVGLCTEIVEFNIGIFRLPCFCFPRLRLNPDYLDPSGFVQIHLDFVQLRRPELFGRPESLGLCPS